MKKILFCTPYEGVSGSNIGGISVWAKAIMDYYRSVDSDVILELQPLDRKTYVRGVNAFVRLWSGIVEYLSLVKKVKRRIIAEEFDIIHLCTTASLGLIKDWLILRYAKSKGLKTVLHFHCGRVPEILKKHDWETWLLHKVVHVTDVPIVMDVQSYEALSVYKRGGVNLPNPLSSFVTETICLHGANVKREKNRLLFVGHLVDIKGVYELVEACSELREGILRMVGYVEDDVREKLQSIASKRPGEWLQIVGGLSREDTIREILSADILVAPSYIEGFPNVILEAMACETPIIASCVGAIPEMLDNGKCGVLIEPRNTEAIRKAISGLLTDEEKKLMLARHAKERVYKKYTMPVVWNQLVTIFEEM